MTYNMLYTYPETNIGISLALHYVHKDDQRVYFHFELNNQTERDFEFSAIALSPTYETETLEFCPEYSWWELLSDSERRPRENPISCRWINTGFCMALSKELATDRITVQPSLHIFDEDSDRVCIDFFPVEVILNDELRIATASIDYGYDDIAYEWFDIDSRSKSALYHSNGIDISEPSYVDDGGMEYLSFSVGNNRQGCISLVFELLSVNDEEGDLEREIKYFDSDENGDFIIEGMRCLPMVANEFIYTISAIDTESKEIIMVLQASTEVDLRHFSIETKIKRLLG